jgi:hypothetical protein
MIVIGRKKLPDAAESGRQKYWGFVDRVVSDPKQFEQESLREQHYDKATRGERTQPAARPAGEGVYAIVDHDSHAHRVCPGTANGTWSSTGSNRHRGRGELRYRDQEFGIIGATGSGLERMRSLFQTQIFEDRCRTAGLMLHVEFESKIGLDIFSLNIRSRSSGTFSSL